MIFKISMELLYSIIYMVPFSILRYYPFRKKLRISIPLLISIYVIFILFQFAGFTYMNWGLNIHAYETIHRVYRIFWTVVYFSLSCGVIKERFSKHFFLYLMMFCFSNLTTEIGYFLEFELGGEFAKAYPYIIVNIVSLIIVAASFRPIIKFMEEVFGPFLENEESYIWNVIWILPTSFIVVNALFSFSYPTESYLKQLISRVIMMGTVIVVIYILIASLRQSEDNAVLKERLKLTGRQLSIQRQQYEAMSKQIEEVRKARHDLRHYLSVVQEYLDSGDKEEMQRYLDEYKSKLPVETIRTVCKNDTLNILLCHYINLYNSQNITADIKIALNNSCGVDDNDLMVIFGNLLENAMEACDRIEDGNKNVRVRAGIIAGKIAIVIANTYNGESIRNGEGYGSLKRGGDYGIGLSSVKAIAEHYKGSVSIEPDKEIFKVNVVLIPKKNKSEGINENKIKVEV